MSIAPRNVWLAFVLAALVGVQLFSGSRRAADRPLGPLFPSLEASAAREIVLTGRDGKGASRTLRLVYEEGLPGLLAADEGAIEGRWVLPDEHGFPARAAFVTALLDHLIGLTTVDLLSSSAEEHAGFRVDDAGLGVRILGAQGRLLANFVQGSATSAGPGGRGSATYVRPINTGDGESDAVYRARRLNPLALDPIQWLETRWLPFDSELVRGLRVRGGEWETGLDIERGETGGWSLAGQNALPSRAVQELLNRIYYLFFDGVEGRGGAQAIGAPALELTVLLETGAGIEEPAGDLTAIFGGERADGSRLSAKPGSPWVVRFDAETFALIETALRQVEGR